MSSHVLVSMEHRTDGRTALHFSWNPDIIDTLKTSIPWQDREWDGTSKTWFIDSRFAKGLARRLTAMGHTVTEEDKRPQPKTVPTAAWVSALFTAVGPERAQPVYKALVKVLHPDNPTTGDTTLAQALTRGYDEVRSRQ